MTSKENNISEVKPKKRILTAEGWKRRNIKSKKMEKNPSQPETRESESHKKSA